MITKISKIGISFILAFSTLCSENYWWSPKQVPVVRGFVDNYQVAVNSSGSAIAMMNDQVLGFLDGGNETWSFWRLNLEGSAPLVYRIDHYEASTINLGEGSYAKAIHINDLNEGGVVFKINEGPEAGKIAFIEFKQGEWKNFKILSQGQAVCPVFGMTDYGTGVAGWINNDESSSSFGRLEVVTKTADEWKEIIHLCDKESIDLSIQQTGPQIGVSEIGDAIVVWKVKSQEDDTSGELLAACYDAIDDKWYETVKLGDQNREFKKYNLSMNSLGDVCVAYYNDENVHVHYLNVSDYIILKTQLSSATNSLDESILKYGSWKKACHSESREVSHIKSGVSDQKTALIAWTTESLSSEVALLKMDDESMSSVGQMIPRSVFDMQISGKSQGFNVCFIAEGNNYDEALFSRDYDAFGGSISQLKSISSSEHSLVDSAERVSFSRGDRGIVMWYDFIKESVFVSFNKNVEEPRYSDRYSRLRDRKTYLIDRKLKLAEKRRERRG